MKLKIGDKVLAPHVGSGAVVMEIKKGSPYVLLEVDELFPFIGLPNPRRKILTHESWVEKVLTSDNENS